MLSERCSKSIRARERHCDGVLPCGGGTEYYLKPNQLKCCAARRLCTGPFFGLIGNTMSAGFLNLAILTAQDSDGTIEARRQPVLS